MSVASLPRNRIRMLGTKGFSQENESEFSPLTVPVGHCHLFLTKWNPRLFSRWVPHALLKEKASNLFFPIWCLFPQEPRLCPTSLSFLEIHGCQNPERAALCPTGRNPWIPLFHNKLPVPNRLNKQIVLLLREYPGSGTRRRILVPILLLLRDLLSKMYISALPKYQRLYCQRF